MLCATWYHLYNLKKETSNQGGVILLVKLQALACNFTKYHSSMGVSHVFKIVQMVPNRAKRHKWF